MKTGLDPVELVGGSARSGFEEGGCSTRPIVWRIPKGDLEEADFLFPGSVRIAEGDGPCPILEFAGWVPPQDAVWWVDPALPAATPPCRVLLTAREDDRQAIEDSGEATHCLGVGLEVADTPDALWRDVGARVGFLLVCDDATVRQLVMTAFTLAFEQEDCAALTLYGAHPNKADSTSTAEGRVGVATTPMLRSPDGCLNFDVVAYVASSDAHRPLVAAALNRGRAMQLRLGGEEPTPMRVAGQLRSAARVFLRDGTLTACGFPPAAVSTRPGGGSWAEKCRLLRQLSVDPPPRPSTLDGVGWVTRWNVKCGIGDHAAHQIAAAEGRSIILAPHEPGLLAADSSNVIRCWQIGTAANGFDELFMAVHRERLAMVMIHFNWGFFEAAQLTRLVGNLRATGRVVVIDLHSTISKGSDSFSLASFAECLSLCNRVLVHQSADLERVLAVSPTAKVTVEPLAIDARAGRQNIRPQSHVIGCFGFCLPNKGIEELILATWMLRHSVSGVRLLLLNAEHPASQSAETVAAVRNLIKMLKLQQAVDFITDYLDEEECLKQLAATSLIVNPYQDTKESASAAVRYALASGTPTLVTPLPIFDDLGDAVFRSSGTRPEQLSESIKVTLTEIDQNSPRSVAVAEASRLWRERHDLTAQTNRLTGLMARMIYNQRLLEWSRFDNFH